MPTVIIGAGISGLSAAYYLARANGASSMFSTPARAPAASSQTERFRRLHHRRRPR